MLDTRACPPKSIMTLMNLYIFVFPKRMDPILLWGPYRPPGQSSIQFNFQWSELLNAFNIGNKEVYLLGDYNMDLLKNVTTDTATLIDNLITNRPLKVIHSSILIEDLSDHLPLLMWIDSSPTTHFATLSQSTHNIDLNSKDTFKNLINIIDWSPIHSLCDQSDPSAAYEVFNYKMRNVYDSGFPFVTSRIKASKTPKQPWMTLGLLRSCHTKAKLHTRFIKHPTPQNKLKFITYRNKFKSLCRKAEKDYYTMQFTKFKDDLKQTWQTIKTILRDKPPDSNISQLTINGLKITDSQSIAEQFNKYFTGVAQDLVNKIPPSNIPSSTFLNPPNLDSFALIPTSPSEIIAISRTLKQTHSTGLDGIKSTLISPVIELIADPLSEIFNYFLKTGVVPVLLKTAKVIPIYKQGHKDDV